MKDLDAFGLKNAVSCANLGLVEVSIRRISIDCSGSFQEKCLATFMYQDGSVIHQGSIHIPPTPHPNFESCYHFAFPKSGSVLINNLTMALMEEAGVPIIDLQSHLFASGISINSVIANLDEIFRPRGYCYLGFRSFPPCMRGELDLLTDRVILMVRGPRDMLVSLYYSFKYSHAFPTKCSPQFAYELSD